MSKEFHNKCVLLITFGSIIAIQHWNFTGMYTEPLQSENKKYTQHAIAIFWMHTVGAQSLLLKALSHIVQCATADNTLQSLQDLKQWYSTWGACTPGSTQGHVRGT